MQRRCHASSVVSGAHVAAGPNTAHRSPAVIVTVRHPRAPLMPASIVARVPPGA